jgi:hypothetical protein
MIGNSSNARHGPQKAEGLEALEFRAPAKPTPHAAFNPEQ